MVKEQPNERAQRSTRNYLKKPAARPTQRNPHLASRGRPRKQRMGTSPFEVQKQFTQQFIEFGKQYLQWKLNDNYVWSNDFDRMNPEQFQKLPIENPKHSQAITNIVANMCNMMEIQVGRQFRQCCIDAYNYYKASETLQNAQQKLIDQVLNNQKFLYLSLRHQDIPKERKNAKPQTLVKFIQSIAELIYKIAEKQAEETAE